MKFVLSLVLVAYVATVVESIFLKEAMDSMKKLSSPDSAPNSYSAPVYEEAKPVYVVKPESTEYVTEVHRVKHVPVKKYKTKHVYSRGYDSDEVYSLESNEYGTYNSGGHVIYRREAPEPSPSAKFWQKLAHESGNAPNSPHSVSRRWANKKSKHSEKHGKNWKNENDCGENGSWRG